MGNLHKGVRTFMTISRWILLRMRNVSNKSCRENQNTHSMVNNWFRKSCRLWDYVQKYGRAKHATEDNIIRRLRFVCRITGYYNHTFRICNTYSFFYGNSGFANTLQCYIYTYISCFLVSWTNLRNIFHPLKPTVKFKCVRLYVPPGLIFRNSTLYPTVCVTWK
jgi:hypothetical protein